MSNGTKDELLALYLNELSFLRSAGTEFASMHKKVASRLELSPTQSTDPNVERLIESFAFLTARLQANLRNQLTQIPIAFLENLYPHLVEPVPSMAIARLSIANITDIKNVPRDTRLSTLTSSRKEIHFQSCYEVDIWPFDVEDVALIRPEPGTESHPTTTHALQVRLRCAGDVKLGDLDLTQLKKIRFYLGNDGQALHEAILRHYTSLQIELPDKLPKPLKEGALHAVGFADDEHVLPDPAITHPGYRLLQEYFTFPDKFLFIDFQLQAENSTTKHPFTDSKDTTVTLRIGLDRDIDTPIPLTRRSFMLACTPIINLFPRTTEPVRLDETRLEYHLIPDSQRLDTTEIHSILQVNETANAENTATIIEPFFATSHRTGQRDRGTYWTSQRRETGLQTIKGTFTHLSFVDLDFTPRLPATRVLYAHTLCTNRTLATQLNPGDRLHNEGSTLFGYCLDTPTPQRNAPVGEGALWNLITQLTLNQLSLSYPGQSDGRELATLQAILRLHSGPAGQHIQQIQGLVGLSTRRVSGRLPGSPWGAYCRGLKVELTFDNASYSGSSAFLLASVLNAFLPLYTSVNSFTQLTITNRNIEGDTHTWPPSHGAIQLL